MQVEKALWKCFEDWIEFMSQTFRTNSPVLTSDSTPGAWVALHFDDETRIDCRLRVGPGSSAQQTEDLNP